MSGEEFRAARVTPECSHLLEASRFLSASLSCCAHVLVLDQSPFFVASCMLALLVRCDPCLCQPSFPPVGKLPFCGSSTAHKPKPYRRKSASFCRFNNVTIFLRKGVRHVLHYPRSALTRANGSRSGSRQWRRIRRSLIRIGLRS